MKKYLSFACVLIVLGSMLFCSGCNHPSRMTETNLDSKKIAYKYFDKNTLLTAAEKSYAKKFLLYIYEKYPLEDTYTVTSKDLNSETYRKWGLGPYRDFNQAEKAYISEIQNIDKAWMIYTEIDMNNLDQSEIEYLAAIHKKHGKNLSVEELTSVDKGGYFSTNVKLYCFIFDFVGFVFDRPKIDDFMLILVLRLQRQAVI